MWNAPSKKRLAKIPRLYETEKVPLRDKLIHLHFFIGGCDWYIAEFDGDDLFWGFAILNNDYEMAEWGYFSLQELSELKVSFLEVDRDLYWKPKRACEIEKICKAQGWAIKGGDKNDRSSKVVSV